MLVDELQLQKHVSRLVQTGSLKEAISGWENLREIVDTAQSPGYDPYIVLDAQVRRKVAESALFVGKRLDHLSISSDHRRSTSMDSNRLLPDLLCVSSDPSAAVIIELKRDRQTERQAVTELLAYEQEVRNHLPFSARSDVCFVLISTEYRTLLDHAIASLVTWHGFRVLCVRVDPATGDLRIHLPLAWTTFGQDFIPAQFVETIDLYFTPSGSDWSGEEAMNIATNALELIRHDSDRAGATGFGFVWVNIAEPAYDSGPVALTIARVNPAYFLADPRVHQILPPRASPLRQLIDDMDLARSWNPSWPGLTAAVEYLSSLGSVRIDEEVSNWAQARSDGRHRGPSIIRQHYCLPAVFAVWGIVADYYRDMLASPDRLGYFYGAPPGMASPLSFPEFALLLLDKIMPEQRPKLLAAKWFGRLGYRLSRLILYVGQMLDQTDGSKRRRLSPMVCWARADAMSVVAELQVVLRHVDWEGHTPPRIVFGENKGQPAEDPDTIRELVEWIIEHLLGESPHILRIFVAAWSFTPATDKFVAVHTSDATVNRATSEAVAHARDILTDAVDTYLESAESAAPLIEILTQRFGYKATVDESLQSIRDYVADISDELLLDEFVNGVLEVVDLVTVPVILDLNSSEIAETDWNLAKALVLEHRQAGRNAGVILDADGSCSLGIFEEKIRTLLGDVDDDHVIVNDRRTLATYIVARWDDLRQGRLGRA